MTKCRFCDTELKKTFVDLGMLPLSNSYVKTENLKKKENFYPLHAYVCSNCFLVQLEEFETPEEIFRDYAYFSSFSDSWLKHAKEYTLMTIERFDLNENSKVIEIASNDGYLLQYFKEKNIHVLGIDPAENVAQEAERKGIRTITKFFGTNLAKELLRKDWKADLMLGNNVLAHVPNINDFVEGIKILLKQNGVVTMEFPHLLQLMNENQFDTIYQEHFSYFSFMTVKKIFEKHGLQMFDVEELPTHGGSLRIFAKHAEDNTRKVSENVERLLEKEVKSGLSNIKTYMEFSENVKKIKRNILKYLIDLKERGSKVVGYGAPAKGNTLLNYCSIGTDFLDYTVDRSPYKQNTFLPGTRIPIYSPEKIRETKPDYIVILPWNIKVEIMEQMKFIKEWGGKFITLIPKVEMY